MPQDCICDKTKQTIKYSWTYSVILFLSATVISQSQIIYQTGFEPEEGYDLQYTLAGQLGWQAEGTGGNGLIKDTFQGLGNQAYIGFWPPENNDEGYINLWRSIENPTAEIKVIRFSVVMMIADSEDNQRDEFRWSIYNSETKRLASVDFDNHSQTINYELDDGEGFRDTGFSFERDTAYDLTIDIDFPENNWDAKIGDVYITENQPLTTSNAKLELGDISAVWVLREIGKPGENFMVFDDYKIEEKPITNPPNNGLSIEMVNDLPVMTFEAGKYLLQSSLDLKSWEDLSIIEDESKFTDTDYTKKKSQRYYRLRLIE
ncbi:MAG: hypothetical protein VYC62_01400 [Verrucomicrobiota bacterium]|nr:hypothetical protein [Verrucomicrobiota bacterium]